MKKGFKVLCIMLIVFLMSGCMKMNVDMSIHKDKSMDFAFTVALADSLLQNANADNQRIMSDEDIQEAKDEGFEVKEYSDGSMTGYTLTKRFKNIDDVSSENNIIFDLDKATKEENDIFTVKKGFFKNIYTVKIKNKTSSELQNSMGSTNDNTYDNSTDYTSDMDLSMLSASIDLKFNVNLPYKALNSNATTTENDGKKLIWNLMDSNLKDIEFSFKLYNMKNIYITVGMIILIIIIIIVIVKRKPKTKMITPLPVNDDQVTMETDETTVHTNIQNPVENNSFTQNNELNENIQTSTPVSNEVNVSSPIKPDVEINSSKETVETLDIFNTNPDNENK